MQATKRASEKPQTLQGKNLRCEILRGMQRVAYRAAKEVLREVV
jgi:hypothetical protein